MTVAGHASVSGSISISVVERQIVPRRRPVRSDVRFGSGVDFGAKGFSLVERRDRSGQTVSMLAWFQGYWTQTCGVRGFGRRYVPAALKLVWNSGFESLVLQQAGRLSNAGMIRHEDAIDRHFGHRVSHMLDMRRTIVISED